MTAMLEKKKFLENKDGFTLLEVIIAMAIMVITFASILTVEGDSINASTRAKQMNIVGMLAKNLMVETEYKIENTDFGEVKKEEVGIFDPPYEDYHWKREIRELKFPALTTSESSSSGGDMASILSKLVTQFFSKAIREVTIVISWKKGSKEQKFSLATYWVDLNYAFQLTE